MELKSKNKRSFGSLGEKFAEEYLVQNGYKPVVKNYRVGRMGEIDIIARENGYICFIEVKTRSNVLYGLPCEAVNKKKQAVIRRLAQVFISQHKLFDANVRFDIVEVIVEKSIHGLNVKDINLIKNAF